MTRWELIKAFHRLARILMTDERSEKETLLMVKEIVLDVLTENVKESPLNFASGDIDKLEDK